ncbi:unnamed protein product [Coccothraustes coccothraustes]
MQGLRKAEDAYLELSGAKGQSRAVVSRSRALESTGTGNMLSGRRSRIFVSGSRRARPLLRREDRSRTILAIYAQQSNSAKDCPVPDGFQQEPRFGKHRHRHHAQCVKKPLLRLREPESAAAAET